MVQQMAPKWLHHGSKMAPWRPLGRPCCQTLPGAVPERLWHGPGRPKKFILAALERPWSEKWIDFGPPKALLEAFRGEKKFQGRPWEKFCKQKGNNLPSGTPLVGGVGAARKSLSWRIRPGKTRLNGFKHAHNRKRWSAD